MDDSADIVEQVRTELLAAGDPTRAAEQQAYLKSTMLHRGLASPQLKALLRPILKSYRPADRQQWEDDVRRLWDDAAFREERYAALAIARHAPARVWRDGDCLELCRHLVTTGAWWDLVDDVATHIVRDALDTDPVVVAPALLLWAEDDDPWLRRTSVIAQVGRRGRVDRELLRAVIEPNLDDPSFWLRKAIGWALRDLSGTDPDWVRAFVAEHQDRLSGLSRREALRRLEAQRPE